MAKPVNCMQAKACKNSCGCIELFRALLLKELNINKIIILKRASSSNAYSVTSALRELSTLYGVPLSTLKQSATSLKGLGLIKYGTTTEPKELRATRAGIHALALISDKLVNK